MPSISFQEPYYLILLVPVCGWFLYFYYRENRKRFTLKKKIALFTRVISGLMVICALAEPALHWEISNKCVIYAVDVSKSFSEEMRGEAYNWIAQDISRLCHDDYFGLIAFSSEGSAEIIPRKKYKDVYKLLRFLKRKHYKVNADMTDIGSAIKLSYRLFPADVNKEIVIITDGDENKGSVLRESLVAKFKGININFLFLSRDMHRGRIEYVNLPKSVLIGEKITGELVLESGSTYTEKLSILINNKPYVQKNIDLEKGENKSVYFPLQFEKPGCYIVSVALGDKNADTVDVPVEAAGGDRVLYVTREPENVLTKILTQKQFKLHVIEPSEFPDSISELESYGAVIIDNVGSSAFKRKAFDSLRQFAHDFGGGVIMVGGKRSFGAGGYFNTAVEKLLPVYMDVRNEDRKQPLNVVFVLDKSQSMGKRTEVRGATKMELAAAAAVTALESLKKQDMVGVVGFDNRVHKVLAMTSLSRRELVKKKIMSIKPEGQTNILLGIKTGYELLQKGTGKKIRHMIMFSDGKPSEKADYEPILQKLKDAHITLSAVGIGNDLDRELMRKLAQGTGGRLYLTEDMFNIARIFKKDLAVATRSMVKNKAFMPKFGDASPILQGLIEPVPELAGHILTTAKKTAVTPIVSDVGDPVISYWQYGLGKTAVFTSDNGAWLSTWNDWKSFPEIWLYMLRLVMKKSQDTGSLHVHVDKQQGRNRALVIDAVSSAGDFLNNLPLSISLYCPDGVKKGIAYEQTEPGRYVAHFEVSERGVYSALVQYEKSDEMYSKTFKFSVASLPEYERDRGNETLLKQIVNVTRGELVTRENAATWKRKYDHKKYSLITLWRYFLASAPVLFLLGLFLERIFAKEKIC